MTRVVVTGIGACAPNGVGVDEYWDALRNGVSGIRAIPELADYGFRCTVGGIPALSNEQLEEYVPKLMASNIHADGIRYGVYAACEAWKMAGFSRAEDDTPYWDTDLIFGSGLAGAEVIAEAVRNVDAHRVKRLGSKTVPNTMASGVSAFIGGVLGIGGRVTTNASACSTGTEAILLGYEAIKSGRCKRALVGACDSAGMMTRSGFDAMRVLNSKMNNQPEKASRPMSASASGFIPSGGGGALVLESMESAQLRGAKIYGEVLGGYQNSGGQRNGGSMTAPNQEAVLRCMKGALENADVSPEQVDLISGHLTATMFDPYEVKLWTETLNLTKDEFPFIQSQKSLIGHCLSASGALEGVACVLQLHHQVLHPTINCEDLHPDIESLIDLKCVSTGQNRTQELKIVCSSSFGFGDANAVVVFGKKG